jgi:glycosyltransferase involved in cell wall biosynthesis
MNVAVDYAAPDLALAGSSPGIRVAIDDFLKAWLRFGNQPRFIFRPQDEASLSHIREIAKNSGIDPDAQCVALDPRTPAQNLGAISCLFRADPAIGNAAWTRRQLAGRGFSLCGLVHTASGDQIARALQDILLAPVDSSDALICPSEAIRKVVLELWELYGAYLDRRFGGAHRCPIQTPVIPLGIDTDKFAALRSMEKRAAQRAALGVDDDEILILFTGRLSFVTKAHPLPTILAVKQAAEKSGKRLRLVFYGYFQPQAEMQPRFQNLIADFAGSLPCVLITNDDPRFPDGLWAAADIFTSLVENVQESFGLTPIEAMAGGLSVVASDWDGYRDGVVQNETGFLIPTGAPPTLSGQEIADVYFNWRNYGLYLAGAAQSTFIDIKAACDAFVILACNPERRAAMGAAGQKRARALYDWRTIIPTYSDLWHDLAERRRSYPRPPSLPDLWPAAHPAFPNPFAAFSSFPTKILHSKTRLRAVMTNEKFSLILKHDMNDFVPELLLPKEVIRQIVEAVRAKNNLAVEDILAFIPEPQIAPFWRSIGWLLKHGICECEAD